MKVELSNDEMIADVKTVMAENSVRQTLKFNIEVRGLDMTFLF